MGIRLLVVAVFLAACSEEEPRAPMAPSRGGGQTVGDVPRAGRGDDDLDAGAPIDAGGGEAERFECQHIDELHYSSDELPAATGTQLPEDFSVTRQVVSWRDGCEAPVLAIALSNGNCPNGSGHELEILVSAGAIVEGRIMLGFNQLLPEVDGMGDVRARYTRPAGFRPSGMYGSCAGASGVLNFYEPPDERRSATLRASFDFMLTPCDGADKPAVRVAGYFGAPLRRTLASVCPSF